MVCKTRRMKMKRTTMLRTTVFLFMSMLFVAGAWAQLQPDEAVADPGAVVAEVMTVADAGDAMPGAAELPVVEGPVGAAEPAPEPEDEEEDEEATDGVATQEMARLSIDVKDAELSDIITLFLNMTDINIISTPTNIRGRVSCRLVDVQWKPAFEQILAMNGMRLSDPENLGVYAIVKKGADQPEPLIVEAIRLKYATVPETLLVVRPSLIARGKISPFASRSMLIVQTEKQNMADIKDLINQIDIPQGQVLIECKFMELTDVAIDKLGINWSVLGEYNIGAGNLGRALSETISETSGRSDTLSKTDTRSNNDLMNQQFDMANRQFEDVTVSYQEMPPGSDNQVAQANITPSRTIADGIARGMSAVSSLNSGVTRTLADARTAVLGVDDFNLMLSALKGQDGVSIVSNPKIIVANGEQATIHIGALRRPFLAETIPATQVSEARIIYSPGDEVKLGITLDVIPTINTDSNITVKIEPSLKRLIGIDSSPDGKTEYPIIGVKSIKTLFNLASGKTAAIGGLTETEDTTNVKKVPLLGDIPLLGKYLFSYKSDEKRRNETIIFVTVSLASSQVMDKRIGIPEDSQLVHRHFVKAARRKLDFEQEMENLADNAKKYEEKVRKRRRILQRRTR
jgi:type II secretory pathway component GspD/PulD (secretin)